MYEYLYTSCTPLNNTVSNVVYCVYVVYAYSLSCERAGIE